MKKVITITALAVLVIAASCQKPVATKAQKPILNKYLEASNNKVNPHHLDATLDLKIAQFVSSIYSLDFAGIDSLKKGIADLMNMFPDFHVIVEDEVYADNISSTRYTWIGAYNRPPHLQLTGEKIKATGFNFYSLRDGKDIRGLHEGSAEKLQFGYTITLVNAETPDSGSK